VDLAWGERSRTGLAVLDGTGRLLESGTVRTDDEIAGFVERFATGTLVAAVDAPLVVPNETGRRSCEAEVGRLFGRYHAGAHPANRGNRMFVPEPRGARLAARFGWELDPAVRPAAGRKVCIEVYPHPAMVSLFALDRVIPYKRKRHRDVPDLRHAYARLLHNIETTCGAVLALPESPRWRDLRAAAAAATRKRDLAQIEDEVDAIFCAYLAWLWATHPDRMTVLGDLATGYIVTPPAPPG
jgi:predicted RNase H-like nuclease